MNATKPIGASLAIEPDAFDRAVDNTMRAINLGPDSTVDGIARLCTWFSEPGREVYARIEWADGKPVVSLVRENPDSKRAQKHEHKPMPGNAEVCSDCGYLAYNQIHKLY